MTSLRRATGRRPRPAAVPCEHAREAISARCDGEEPGVSDAIVDDHVAKCQGCQRFQSELASLSRRARLRASRPAPEGLLAELLPLLASGPAATSKARPGRPAELKPGLGWLGAARWAAVAAPALAAVVALPLGALAQPHLLPHLAPNGCINYLLQHHTWPGSQLRQLRPGGL